MSRWSFKYNIIPNGKHRVKRNKQILPSLSFSVWYDITWHPHIPYNPPQTMHKETSHMQIREAILYPPFPILWMLSLVFKWYLISHLCDIALPIHHQHHHSFCLKTLFHLMLHCWAMIAPPIHHQHPTLALILASTGPQTVTSIQNV